MVFLVLFQATLPTTSLPYKSCSVRYRVDCTFPFTPPPVLSLMSPSSRNSRSRESPVTAVSNRTTLASEVIAASVGGAISAGVLYPLEVLKTKMQAQHDDRDKDEQATTMWRYAARLYRQQGWQIFVRGLETSALQSATEKALYFFAYTILKNAHQSVTHGKALGTATNLVLGCAAEWVHLPVSLPIDVWTTKIQTSSSADHTPLKILLTMLAEPNKAQWYQGWSAYTLLCLKPALQYTVYEQVKAAVVQTRQNKTLTAVEAFLLGMVARTVATVVVFPFLRAKVLLQTAKEPDTASASLSTTTSKPSVITLLTKVYERDGLAGLFQGLGPELTRGIFSAALMLMMKEKLASRVQRALDAKSNNVEIRSAIR
jgi:hypothetical protein